MPEVSPPGGPPSTVASGEGNDDGDSDRGIEPEAILGPGDRPTADVRRLLRG
jgi:hypothetical protein